MPRRGLRPASRFNGHGPYTCLNGASLRGPFKNDKRARRNTCVQGFGRLVFWALMETFGVGERVEFKNHMSLMGFTFQIFIPSSCYYPGVEGAHGITCGFGIGGVGGRIRDAHVPDQSGWLDADSHLLFDDVRPGLGLAC